MQYVGRTPGPPLDAYIERIWYCSAVPAHARERVLPGGTVDLIINLAQDRIEVYEPADPQSPQAHSGTVVRGPYTRSFLVDPRQRESVVGVHFRPGGALPFLAVSPSELVDSFVPLEDLWRRAGTSLREQLLEAQTPIERIAVLERALLRKLEGARPGHSAVRAAMTAFRSAGSDVRVADVASDIGLSHRGFVEVFKREVGLTPKLYLRLQRFHRVKQRIAAFGAPASWAAFALECGYFDQSHMIREFGEFSSLSPTSYLRSRSDETMFDHLVHGSQPRGE